MGVWSSTATTAAASLQQERRQGTLELLVAAPTPFPLLILPMTLSMATVGAYSLVATLLWGRFVFGIDIAVRHPAGFVAACLATVAAVGVLGFLVAVSSVRYRTAWALGTALEFPVWLLCGFLVPLSLMPGWTRPVSWLLAPTWGLDAIRAAAAGGNPLPGIAACLGLAAAYGVLGTLLARRLVDSARANATLALS
jgi:ABC-2 type transport system permease protein